MAENLNIFGETYTNVTGIKAYDTGGNIQTYIKPQGTVNITQNGTVDVSQYASADVSVSAPTPSYQSKTVTPTTSQQTVTADSGYDALSQVTVNAMPQGSATAPRSINGTNATVSVDTSTISLQRTVSVTPTVSRGYVSTGTRGNSTITLTANFSSIPRTTYHPSTSDQTILSAQYLRGTQTIKGVTMTNLTAENIKDGVTVQIGDSTDSDCVTSVTGTYQGSGGGSVNIDTKTLTASNYPTTLSFTGMLGEPKAFFLRCTSQISSSGSTTYYYIIDMRYDGTNTTGNYFRIGSTRAVYNATSGYSFTYSGTTLTITSSASSRSATPGAFNNGYELVYVY